MNNAKNTICSNNQTKVATFCWEYIVETRKIWFKLRVKIQFDFTASVSSDRAICPETYMFLIAIEPGIEKFLFLRFILPYPIFWNSDEFVSAHDVYNEIHFFSTILDLSFDLVNACLVACALACILCTLND